MSIHKIRSALVKTLESGGLAVPIAYENTNEHNPQSDEPWIEPFFIFNQPRVFTLGSNGQNEHTGILQINLNYPVHEGVGAALVKADEVCALFKSGSYHTQDEQTVFVLSSGISRAGQLTGSFYQTNLTIQFRAYTPR